MKLIVIFLLIAIFILSCGKNATDNSSFQQQISVTGLLSPVYEFQEVFVYYTTDKVGEPVDPTQLFVTNAIVTIRSENQEVNFSYYLDEQNRPKYIDQPTSLQIVAGEIYHLSVQSDAGNISGQTTVPGNFQILAPQNGSILAQHQPYTVSWTTSQNAAAYIINLKLPPQEIQITPDSSIIYQPVETYHTFDSALTIPAYVFREPGKYMLQIMACDENFKRHFFDEWDVAGIEGGYGYFASGAVDTLHFFVE